MGREKFWGPRERTFRKAGFNGPLAAHRTPAVNATPGQSPNVGQLPGFPRYVQNALEPKTLRVRGLNPRLQVKEI